MITIVLFPPKPEIGIKPWTLQVPAVPKIGDIFVYSNGHSYAVEMVCFCCPEIGDESDVVEIQVKLRDDRSN